MEDITDATNPATVCSVLFTEYPYLFGPPNARWAFFPIRPIAWGVRLFTKKWGHVRYISISDVSRIFGANPAEGEWEAIGEPYIEPRGS